MKRLIVLDTGVAGLLTNPRPAALAKTCRQWFNLLQAAGDVMVLPEIVDYELRREFLLNDALESIDQLEELARGSEYIRLNTEAMRQAAFHWANIRKRGQPPADRHALDGDVIVAAQAALLEDLGGGIIIATTNVKHLIRFADARLWTAIDVSA